MENIVEKQTEDIQSPSIGSSPEPPDETTQIEQSPPSLVQSLLLERTDGTDNKKKKKIKTARQKELERLTKATKNIFASPEQLNIVSERINSLLSGHKTMLLAVCHSFDKLNSGRLSYEQFRLVIRDRLPKMSTKDLFILMKLFEIEGFIDYRAILDEKFGHGILKHITALPVPPPKEIILEKKLPKEIRPPFNEPLQLNHPKYVTVHLRFIPFDSFNTYPGHIHLTVPDHISIYALSKMVIDQTDLATRFINIFREKVHSHSALLNPMCTLENCRYTGAYRDGTHKQSFPSYTLYYDYLPMGTCVDCPTLKCDYYMK